jgi:hypothetical protein
LIRSVSQEAELTASDVGDHNRAVVEAQRVLDVVEQEGLLGVASIAVREVVR